MWRLEVPQGSHLVPLQDRAPPLLVSVRVTPTPMAHFSSPDRGLLSMRRDHQGSELLGSGRGGRLLSFPSRRNEPCSGAVSAHLNAGLSVVSVLGLPGPASGWLGLGVQPPPAAHAAAHLPGGGPLLHQQAQAGRVAGTLEKGGEAPSGPGPSQPHSIGRPEVSFGPTLRLSSGPG